MTPYLPCARSLGYPEAERPDPDAELGQLLQERQAHVRQTHGYRRIWLWLESQGIYSNPKTVLQVVKKAERAAGETITHKVSP